MGMKKEDLCVVLKNCNIFLHNSYAKKQYFYLNFIIIPSLMQIKFTIGIQNQNITIL